MKDQNCEDCKFISLRGNIDSKCRELCYDPARKPPLGLTPKYMWRLQRLQNIAEAIERYTDVNKEIPIEWIEEYNELAVLK